MFCTASSSEVFGAARKSKKGAARVVLVDLTFRQFELKVPAGWSTVVDAVSGTIRSTQSATTKDSPKLSFMFRNSKSSVKMTGAKLATDFLAQTGAKVTVKTRELLAGGHGVVLEARLRRGPVVTAATFVTFVDPKSGQGFAASFIALPAQYAKLGGSALLFGIVATIHRRKASSASSRSGTGRPTMGDEDDPELDVTSGLPPLTGARVDPKVALNGRWRSAGMGARLEGGDLVKPMRDDFLPLSSGYTFTTGGAYTLRYSAEGRTGFCFGKVALVEVGTYRFSGTTIKLNPTKRTGEICRCSCRKKQLVNTKRKEKLPPRSFETYFGADKRRFVLRGHCATWMVHGACRSVAGDGPPDRVHDETFERVH